MDGDFLDLLIISSSCGPTGGLERDFLRHYLKQEESL